MGELDVVQEHGVDGWRSELEEGFGNTLTGSFNGDVGVLVEVDTTRLVDTVVDFSVKFLLHPHVPVTDDMFSVLPRTESIGYSTGTATTRESTSRSESTSRGGIPVSGSGSVGVGEVSCTTAVTTSSAGERRRSFTDRSGQCGRRTGSGTSHVRRNVGGSAVVHRVVERHTAHLLLQVVSVSVRGCGVAVGQRSSHDLNLCLCFVVLLIC
jgi:hypothetical protein